MGGLTYIEHEGRELQSYLDRLGNTYKIGDKIPWKPLFSQPGQWSNGYDEAWRYEGNTEHPYILVIKDLTLIDVIEVPFKDGLADREAGYKLAREKHGTDFETPPRDLWPEIAWECRDYWWKKAEDRYNAERDTYLDSIRKNWKPPTPKCPQPCDEHGMPFFLLEPQTLEDALQYAEAVFSVRNYTRAALQQPSMTRCLMNVWKEVPELLAPVRDEILAEFVPQIGWKYGEEMLQDAVRYRVERLLKERGHWPDNAVEYPITVRVEIGDGTLEIAVSQLTDECAVPLQPGEQASISQLLEGDAS